MDGWQQRQIDSPVLDRDTGKLLRDLALRMARLSNKPNIIKNGFSLKPSTNKQIQAHRRTSLLTVWLLVLPAFS